MKYNLGGNLTRVILWVLFFGLALSVSSTLAEEPLVANVEIFLKNNTSRTINVQIEPIGMIFNDLLEYSLTSSSQHPNYPNKNITGINIDVPPTMNVIFPIVNHIATPQSLENQPGITQNHKDNHIGFGRYRVYIERFNSPTWGYVDVDFTDADYSYSNLNNDIFLRIEESGSSYALYWEGNPDFLLTPNQDLIEIWNQTRIGSGSKTQNTAGFKIVGNVNIPMGSHITPGNLFVNLEIQADATVLSGKTFTVEAGNTVTFDNNKKLTVNGTLDVNGTTANPVTFTASGTSWNGIYFASGSSGTLSHCTMDKLCGGWGSGAITISNSSPSFTDCTIYVLPGSYVYGVSASGSGSSPITSIFYQSTIRSASGPALFASGSAGYISVHDSEIIQTSGNPTVRASGGSGIEFWVAATIYDGKNKVKGGELYADGGALINAGSASGAKDSNHFCDTAGASLHVSSGGTVYARYDYWPNGAAPTQINNGGSIYYDNNRGASSCAGVSSIVSIKDSKNNAVTASDGWRDLLYDARSKATAGLASEAISLFTQIVQGKQMPEAHTALLELVRLYPQTKDPAIERIIAVTAKEAGPLQAAAMKGLADIYTYQGNLTRALAKLTEITTKFSDRADAFFAVLAMVDIYFYDGDLLKAQELLDSIQIRNDEEANLVAAAQQRLNLETGKTVVADQAVASKPAITAAEHGAEQTAGQLTISSHPNPFNPATTMRYTLPVAGHVVLRVYDVRGREVAVLVNEVQSSGEHSVVFDGRELASGVYV